MQFSAASDRGRVRTRNEDTYCIVVRPDGILAAVADGMGGMHAGNVASQIAIATLEDRARTGDLQSLDLPTVFREVNVRVRAEAGRERMGTTLTAVLVLQSGSARFSHVGDSRLYLWAPVGRLVRITHDHSLAEELLRAGEDNAHRVEAQRNMLTRAVGVQEHLEVDSGALTLGIDERLLLVTDGVSRTVGDSELSDLLGGPFDGLADRLVQLANDRGGEDNATALALCRMGRGRRRA